MLIEAEVYRYNKERDPTWAKLYLLTAPCPWCHGGKGPFVHSDDCAECQGEEPCECPEFCDVCGGQKRFRVGNWRGVARFTFPSACSL
jgi:hypothetical protein